MKKVNGSFLFKCQISWLKNRSKLLEFYGTHPGYPWSSRFFMKNFDPFNAQCISKGISEARSYMDFFEDPHFVRAIIEILPAERTQEQVDFIEHVLGLPPGSHILEVGCGHRPFIELVKRGYRLTAVDLSPVLLQYAKKLVKNSSLDCQLILGDMRNLNFDQAFDAVIQWSAFGYFDDDGNRDVFGQLAKVLKHGGRYVINLRNREWMIKHDLGKRWHITDDFVLLEEYSFDPIAATQSAERFIIIDNGKCKRSQVKRRFYTLQEFKALLGSTGFSFLNVYGDYAKSPFTIDAPRMIILSKKIT